MMSCRPPSPPKQLQLDVQRQYPRCCGPDQYCDLRLPRQCRSHHPQPPNCCAAVVVSLTVAVTRPRRPLPLVEFLVFVAARHSTVDLVPHRPGE